MKTLPAQPTAGTITAANTGSTLLWNKSVKVGGAAFFPIFLTMCSGQITFIMATKFLWKGLRYSAGEIIGAEGS